LAKGFGTALVARSLSSADPRPGAPFRARQSCAGAPKLRSKHWKNGSSLGGVRNTQHPLSQAIWLPAKKKGPWPPIIASRPYLLAIRDAVLVDAFINRRAVSRSRGELVAASGKNLTTICATQGHGIISLVPSTVLERVPDARFVARPDVVAIMRQQVIAMNRSPRFGIHLPGIFPAILFIAQEPPGTIIALECQMWSSCPSVHRYGQHHVLHVPSSV